MKSIGSRPSPARARAAAPVRILQIFCVLLFVLPSFAVIKPIGAAAFPAGLVGMGAMLVWAVWTSLGMHDPLKVRTPIRAAFGILWTTSLLSYIAMQFRSRSTVDILAGDRWLLFLAAITGVAFLAAECVTSLDELKQVLRALCWAAAFCGFVAVLQFFFYYDLTPRLGRLIVGFTYVEGLGGIQFRGGLNRVPGTTLHPIELGTTAAMVLPVAIYMAMYDKDLSQRRRILPVVLIGASIPLSLSRSAVVAVVAALAVFIVGLPAKQRVVALAAMPLAVALVFLSLRGTISTLTAYFRLGGSDPSVSTRTDDYAFVEELVRHRPWFGQGGGTYQPTDALAILDNQYLKWAIEFGLVGLFSLVLFFAIPAAAAFLARKRGTSPELRVLNGALAASVVAGALSSATFDSLSFPVFTCVTALLVGAIGAGWRFTGVRPRWAIQEGT